MIRKENGVQATVVDKWGLPGMVHVVLNVHWKTEPGWVELSFDRLALCLATEEIGGRCQVRMRPDQLQGDYFGSGHLSLIAAGQPVIIYASEMRQARLFFYLLDTTNAPYLSPEEALSIAGTQSLYMFRSEPVQVCATVLGQEDLEDKGGNDLYRLSLTRALMAALLDVVRPQCHAPSPKLAGEALARVLSYLLDNLDQTVTIEELAEIAAISPTQFSKAFRETTGLSPQRWQMDSRVRSAQRLMIDDPEESLAEIAALTGFSDQSHFSRAFIEIVGATPTAWLHRHK
jgi:AraC family transcriptional regulator